MKFNEVCINCFNKTNGFEICPHCGCIQQEKPKQLNHLYPFVQLNNRYVIGKVINNGGFGVVYKAYDTNLNSVVAIKELFPTQNSMVTRVPGTTKVISYSGEKGEQFKIQKNRFLTEARTMSKLSYCEGIVDVYDFFEENNTAYLVMEYLDGMSLRDYMNTYPEKLSFKDAMDIIEPIMKALIAVHKEKIIHRDVSPDNVFITGDKKVKLLDFGAAKIAEEESEKSITVVAKPGYTPPEQYRSKAKIKPYTDVYATGAMLYRMLTGKLPEESIDRLEKDTLARPSKLGADVPPFAEKSIMKAMALNENARFKNMSDFLAALKGKKKADFPEKELKKKKIIRWTSFVAVILICTVAVIAGILIKGNMGIVPSAGEHTITIWLTDSDKEDVGNSNTSRWETIAKNYYKNFCSEQDENLVVDVNVEYYREDEYNDKFVEAEVKPDIFRSDLVEDSEKYSSDLNSLYDEIDESNMTSVYTTMKNQCASSNEFAVRYDTLVMYCFNSVKPDKDSIYSYKSGSELSVNPDAFWYLADKLGYVSNSSASDILKLANYVDVNAKKNFAKNKINYYIGKASESSSLENLKGKYKLITYSYAPIPGDKSYYAYFPERFAVSNTSSVDNKKASMFFLYYVATNNDVQYSVLKNSDNSYLSMLKNTVNVISENSNNEEITLYKNADKNYVYTIKNDDILSITADMLSLKNDGKFNPDNILKLIENIK
jgi:serine/threonine protein kinase